MKVAFVKDEIEKNKFYEKKEQWNESRCGYRKYKKNESN